MILGLNGNKTSKETIEVKLQECTCACGKVLKSSDEHSLALHKLSKIHMSWMKENTKEDESLNEDDDDNNNHDLIEEAKEEEGESDEEDEESEGEEEEGEEGDEATKEPQKKTSAAPKPKLPKIACECGRSFLDTPSARKSHERNSVAHKQLIQAIMLDKSVIFLKTFNK